MIFQGVSWCSVAPRGVALVATKVTKEPHNLRRVFTTEYTHFVEICTAPELLIVGTLVTLSN